MEAITSYDKALAINSTDSDVINGKAYILAKLGKNEEALILIEKALKLDPDENPFLLLVS